MPDRKFDTWQVEMPRGTVSVEVRYARPERHEDKGPEPTTFYAVVSETRIEDGDLARLLVKVREALLADEQRTWDHVLYLHYRRDAGTLDVTRYRRGTSPCLATVFKQDPDEDFPGNNLRHYWTTHLDIAHYPERGGTQTSYCDDTPANRAKVLAMLELIMRQRMELADMYQSHLETA